MTHSLKHSQVATNGISLHMVEAGEGLPVLFCHGFPDTWRTWRQQLAAVAAAGYRAIAVDMRGFGRSSAPADAALYTPFHTVGDLVGLLAHLGLSSVVVVGHDFGAAVAWQAALMRPDLFRGVFCLSVPFMPRGETSFLDQLRAAGQTDFYMFDQMKPEADAEWADAARTIPGALYWASGTPPAATRWSPFDPARRLTRPAPVAVPPWADPADVAYTVAEFARTGFHGPLNNYRMIQLFFDLSGAFAGAVIRQPSFFLMGLADGANETHRATTEELRQALPGLVGHVELEGVGHWVQQEAPAATNAALLGFLQEVGNW